MTNNNFLENNAEIIFGAFLFVIIIFAIFGGRISFLYREKIYLPIKGFLSFNKYVIFSYFILSQGLFILIFGPVPFRGSYIDKKSGFLIVFFALIMVLHSHKQKQKVRESHNNSMNRSD